MSRIINLDFPKDISGYIHRVWRTTRGTNQGKALSIVSAEINGTFLETKAQVQDLMSPQQGKCSR